MVALPTENGRIGCLKDYTSDCQKKDLKSFVALHGKAFLVHHGPIGKLREPIKEKKTMAVEGGDVDEYFDPREDFLVFEVRQHGGQPSKDDLIRLGRNALRIGGDDLHDGRRLLQARPRIFLGSG
jgi:hypothetical protein